MALHGNQSRLWWARCALVRERGRRIGAKGSPVPALMIEMVSNDVPDMVRALFGCVACLTYGPMMAIAVCTISSEIPAVNGGSLSSPWPSARRLARTLFTWPAISNRLAGRTVIFPDLSQHRQIACDNRRHQGLSRPLEVRGSIYLFTQRTWTETEPHPMERTADRFIVVCSRSACRSGRHGV